MIDGKFTMPGTANPPQVINKSTTITLVDVLSKLNTHIQQQNAEGWELFSVVQQAIGIQEYMILFWRKTV